MNILHIDCSPRPESHSRRLSAAVVERLLKFDGSASITRRDLGFEPIPHTTPDYAAILSVPVALPRGAAEEATRLSETLIREIEAADVLVIGTPMNNFTVPSVLKAWIEQIVRLGRTIVPSPTGKVGTLRDRPVFVGIASGGAFPAIAQASRIFSHPICQPLWVALGLNRCISSCCRQLLLLVRNNRRQLEAS